MRQQPAKTGGGKFYSSYETHLYLCKMPGISENRSCQCAALQPLINVISDLFVVQLLEHEVGVAGDADFRQIDHSAVTAIGIVLGGKGRQKLVDMISSGPLSM